MNPHIPFYHDCYYISKRPFHVIRFVNDQLNNAEFKNKKEIIAGFVSKLQLYIEKISFSLEQSSNQLTVLPWTINELQVLQSQMNLLMKKCYQLQRNIECIQNSAEVCINGLEYQELSFKKLLTAKHDMQESGGWEKLHSELNELLEQNDIVGAKHKLNAMKKSFIAQTKMFGHEERNRQLLCFMNKIETLASPKVVHCIQTGDSVGLIEYMDVFIAIGRVSQFKQSYRSIHKNQLFVKWQNISKSGEGAGALTDFYQTLLDFIKSQRIICKQMFTDEFELLDTIIETLIYIQSDRETFTMNLMELTSRKFEWLITVAELDINFMLCIKKEYDSKIPMYKWKQICEGIFSYFDKFVELYSGMEATYLGEIIHSIDVYNDDLANVVLNFATYNAKIFKAIQDVLIRCVVITLGKPISDIVNSIRLLIIAYVAKINELQMRLTGENQTEQISWRLLELNINLIEHISNLLLTIERCESNLFSFVHSSNLFYINGKVLKIGNYIELMKKFTVHNQIAIDLSQQSVLLKNIASKLHYNILKIIVIPINKYFLHMDFTIDEKRQTNDLPDYSCVPQEYITQIGQHLLTLPQHLEPLLLNHSTSFKSVMEACDSMYLNGTTCADVLLNLIVKEISEVYVRKIDEICSLSISGTKQLAIDIEYFENIVEEIGQQLSHDLKQIVMLLRTSTEQYNQTSVESLTLFASIRQKRNIL